MAGERRVSAGGSERGPPQGTGSGRPGGPWGEGQGLPAADREPSGSETPRGAAPCEALRAAARGPPARLGQRRPDPRTGGRRAGPCGAAGPGGCPRNLPGRGGAAGTRGVRAGREPGTRSPRPGRAGVGAARTGLEKSLDLTCGKTTRVLGGHPAHPGLPQAEVSHRSLALEHKPPSVSGVL